MNSSQRLLTAMAGGRPDRVPLTAWFSLQWLSRVLGQTPRHILDGFASDPFHTIVACQERWGLDPIVLTFSEFEDEVIEWPRRLLSWPEGADATWHVERTIAGRDGQGCVIRRTVATPEGQLTSQYRAEPCQKWTLEHLLKEESDLELLKHRPDPALLQVDRLAALVRAVGPEGLVLHIIPGVWYGACALRGGTQLCLDVYDRPKWVLSLLEVECCYWLRHLQRLAGTGLKAIQIDESWVGMGLSRETYERFVLPFDRELVRTAQAAGLLVDYHNCGRSEALLESMAETGCDTLEPLTPRPCNGDVSLADAKRRIGGRVALCGGFDQGVLSGDDPEAVRAEVRRCIDEGAAGGGYIIRCAHQITAARPGNLRIMADEVHRYGKYA